MNLDRNKLAGHLTKNSFYSFVEFIWPLVLFFFSVPYFISKLGNEQYGIWMLILSVVGVMGVLKFGVGDSLIKFVSEHHAREDIAAIRETIRNSLFIFLCIALMTVIVWQAIVPVFLGMFQIKETHLSETTFALRIAVFGFAFNIFAICLLSVLKGFQRYDRSTRVSMAADTVEIFSMLAVLYMGWGIRGMAAAYVGGAIIRLCISVVIIKRFIPELNLIPVLDMGVLKRIFGLSMGFFLITLVGVIRVNFGALAIGCVFGPAFVPFFAVPLQFANKLLSCTNGFTTVLFPAFSYLNGKAEYTHARWIYVTSSKLVVLLCGGIGMTLFFISRDFLGLWINADFARTADVPFKILMLCATVSLPHAIGYYVTLGSGRIWRSFFYQFGSCLFVLVAGLLVIKPWGLTGLAIVYGLGFLILNSFVVYAVRSLFVKDHLKMLAGIFAPMLAGAILAGTTHYFLRADLTSWAGLTAYSAGLFCFYIAGFCMVDYSVLKTGLQRGLSLVRG